MTMSKHTLNFCKEPGLPLNFTTIDQPSVVPAGYIRQETGRRVFSAIFGPPTSNCPYPPFPLEVDDEYIHAAPVGPQPAGKLSKLVGFNINVRIYQTVTPLSTMELAYGYSGNS
ncbi:hypothetical protein MBM_07919 [Drepanopeziza brunnea f. sp. 'multigermtubi' MB_m1]|uniref:Uncharacterized protein n=1 Tax=Marssonina brunnea f. sp. multigermtubi (strain MB_m1) TaxID=1072389 RepID=K1WYN0_MARBU|nr:uncharacterized protein MBM_07919 [Drepanopeziza brunnea f. sp. 'multigermtubi' MB_m1]EKD13718.1 hypothetical protein MBM_07919 [Drepanopeziza brunnea f. sp. 'multigermtubi' MB_m1]